MRRNIGQNDNLPEQFIDKIGAEIEKEFAIYLEDRNNYIPSYIFRTAISREMQNLVNNNTITDLHGVERILIIIRLRRERDGLENPPSETIAAIYGSFFEASRNNYPEIAEVTEYLARLTQSQQTKNLVPLIAASYVANHDDIGRRNIYTQIVDFLEQNDFEIEIDFARNCNMAQEDEDLENEVFEEEEVPNPVAVGRADIELLIKRSKEDRHNPER